MNGIPGPKGNLFLGNLREMMPNPVLYMGSQAQNFGDIIRFRVLHNKFLFVNHPEFVKHILHTNNKNYTKSSAIRQLKLLMGNGIFVSEGEKWIEQRRKYQSAFSKSNIEQYAKVVQECTKNVIIRFDNAIQLNQPVNISREMTNLAMEIVAKCLFSTDIKRYGDQVMDTIGVAQQYVHIRMKRHRFNIPSFIPTKNNRRFNTALRKLDAVMNDIIANRIASDSNYDDLLSKLLQEFEINNSPLTKKQIRDELVSILIAGYETSANALTWLFHLMSNNMLVQSKIREELQSAVAGDYPKFADLRKMRYTRQVIFETLRLYPPLWLIGRRTIKPDQIGGFHIPANCDIAISPYHIHRHKSFWNDPERFDPERFTADKIKKMDSCMFIPFGAGPRLCIGQDFALMEMAMIIGSLIRRYKFINKNFSAVKMGSYVTLKPSTDLIMEIEQFVA